MTPRSRRNNRISSACGIVSIFIEASFLSLPENLSDPGFELTHVIPPDSRFVGFNIRGVCTFVTTMKKKEEKGTAPNCYRA